MKNIYYYVGVNPTVDLVIISPDNKILLIQRDDNYPVCAGQWALPGGFIDSTAKRGEIWQAGLESPEQAAVREVKEETGLDVRYQDIHFVGAYEGNQRDPRDNEISWSKSHAYSYLIDEQTFNEKKDTLIAQVGEIKNIAWHDIQDVLNMELAFDHKEIIKAALRQYNLLPKNGLKP